VHDRQGPSLDVGTQDPSGPRSMDASKTVRPPRLEKVASLLTKRLKGVIHEGPDELVLPRVVDKCRITNLKAERSV